MPQPLNLMRKMDFLDWLVIKEYSENATETREKFSISGTSSGEKITEFSESNLYTKLIEL